MSPTFHIKTLKYKKGEAKKNVITILILERKETTEQSRQKFQESFNLKCYSS